MTAFASSVRGFHHGTLHFNHRVKIRHTHLPWLCASLDKVLCLLCWVEKVLCLLYWVVAEARCSQKTRAIYKPQATVAPG